jgi:hypothetical protein
MDEATLHRNMMKAYLATGVFLLALFLVSLFLQGSTRDALLREGGIVETASALGYLPSLALIAYRKRLVDLAPLVVLILFFLFREMDFDKRFTTMGIFKIRFFTSPEVPHTEKVIGTLFILLLAFAAFALILRHGRAFLTGLRQRSVVAIGALLVLLLLVTSKGIDSLAGNLRQIGISWSGPISMHAGALEEIVELGIPVVIFLALWAHLMGPKAPLPSR